MLSHRCSGTVEDTNCIICLLPVIVSQPHVIYISSTPNWRQFDNGTKRNGNDDQQHYRPTAVCTPSTSVQLVHEGQCEQSMNDKRLTEHARRFVYPDRHQSVVRGYSDLVKLQQHPSLVGRFADDNDLNPRIESSYLTSPQDECLSYSITVDPGSNVDTPLALEADNHSIDTTTATNVLLRHIQYDWQSITQDEESCYNSGMIVFDLGQMELSKYTGLASTCRYTKERQWKGIEHVHGWFHLGNESTTTSSVPSSSVSSTCHAYLVLVFLVSKTILSNCMLVDSERTPSWTNWLETIDGHEQKIKQPAVRMINTFIQQVFASQIHTNGMHSRFVTLGTWPVNDDRIGYSVNQQSIPSSTTQYTYFIHKRAFYQAPGVRDLLVYQANKDESKLRGNKKANQPVFMPIVYENEADINTELDLQTQLIPVKNTLPMAVTVYSRVRPTFGNEKKKE
jgi:hypothetical protein